MRGNMPFWLSRIFWIAALVIVSMTVLLVTGALTLPTEAVVGIYATVLAGVAGLSRRASDIQPQVSRPLVDDNGMAVLVSALSSLVGPPGKEPASSGSSDKPPDAEN